MPSVILAYLEIITLFRVNRLVRLIHFVVVSRYVKDLMSYGLAIACNMYRQIFCDFGEHFTVTDTTGEQPVRYLVASVSQVRAYTYTSLLEQKFVILTD